MTTDPTDTDTLSPDDVLAEALAWGLSMPKAAKKAGMSLRQAWRRATAPEVRRKVDDRRGLLTRRAIAMIGRRMVKAVKVLDGLLDDPNPKVRLAAAAKLLDVGIKGREVEELQKDIHEIRERLDAADREKKRERRR